MNFKKFIFPTIIVALCIFNPQEEQYLTALSSQVKDQMKKSFCKEKELTEFAQQVCHQMVTPVATSSLVKSGFKLFNHRQNLGLFSIYTTDLGVVEIKAIGIAGQILFLPISEGK